MRQYVLNRLMSRFDQYARELGLSISDEQGEAGDLPDPVFQTNGKFDNQRFQRYCRPDGDGPPIRCAQVLRNQLTTQQLINAIAGVDFMLPGESTLAAVSSTAGGLRSDHQRECPGGKTDRQR